jgi:hypothetical protein
MNEGTAGNGCPPEIRVFTFSLMGVKIGMDTEQVAAVMEVTAAEARGLPLYHFHEMIPFAAGPVVYQAPKAVLIRDEGAPYLVVIDNPGDIVELGVGAIQALPAVITGTGSRRPFWGAVLEKNGIMLLVDFSRF